MLSIIKESIISMQNLSKPRDDGLGLRKATSTKTGFAEKYKNQDQSLWKPISNKSTIQEFSMDETVDRARRVAKTAVKVAKKATEGERAPLKGVAGMAKKVIKRD